MCLPLSTISKLYSSLYALVGSLDTLPIHSLHLTIIGAYSVIECSRACHCIAFVLVFYVAWLCLRDNWTDRFHCLN